MKKKKNQSNCSISFSVDEKKSIKNNLMIQLRNTSNYCEIKFHFFFKNKSRMEAKFNTGTTMLYINIYIKSFHDLYMHIMQIEFKNSILFC